MEAVSGVILTKNEQQNIRECIKCLNFCSEIILIDDFSSDKTAKVARNLGARVFKRKMGMDYSAQSNFGMSKAEGEWVLFLDADERISGELKKEILSHVGKASSISGFMFKRSDYIWEHKFKYGEAGAIKLIRMVRKNKGVWKRRVHPNFTLSGDYLLLRNPLLHYSHEGVGEFINTTNRWSTWHAIANMEEGKKSSVIKVVCWPVAHFVKNFIFKLGFLDGTYGFVFAIIMSFHSFLSWGKLLMKQKGFKNI